jgi:hypothetical protein
VGSKSGRIGAAIIAVCVALFCPAAFAQPAGGAVPESSDAISFLQTAFDESQTSAAVWQDVWTGVYALGMVGSMELIATDDSRRVPNIVAGADELLALAVLALDPLNAGHRARDFRALSGSASEKQATGEAWLLKDAKREGMNRSVVNHALLLAVGLISGGIVWAHDGYKEGLLSFGQCFVVSEIELWTMPTRSLDEYRAYKARFKGSEKADNSTEKNWFFAASPT